MITDESTAASLRRPLRFQDLSPNQRSLVELMHRHQFGRIENMPVHAGEPVLNSDAKIVRIARFGGENHSMKPLGSAEFQLKKQVWDLLDELDRLQDGTVIRLEFRHGLPFALETAAL